MLYLWHRRNQQQSVEYMTSQDGQVPTITVSFMPPVEMFHGRPLDKDNLAFRIVFEPQLNISSEDDVYLQTEDFDMDTDGLMTITWSDVPIPGGTSEISARVFVYLREESTVYDNSVNDQGTGTPVSITDETIGLQELGEISRVEVTVEDYDVNGGDDDETDETDEPEQETITIAHINDGNTSSYTVTVQDDVGNTIAEEDLGAGDSFAVNIQAGYRLVTEDATYLKFGTNDPTLDNVDGTVVNQEIPPGLTPENDVHIGLKFEPVSTETLYRMYVNNQGYATDDFGSFVEEGNAPEKTQSEWIELVVSQRRSNQDFTGPNIVFNQVPDTDHLIFHMPLQNTSTKYAGVKYHQDGYTKGLYGGQMHNNFLRLHPA